MPSLGHEYAIWINSLRTYVREEGPASGKLAQVVGKPCSDLSQFHFDVTFTHLCCGLLHRDISGSQPSVMTLVRGGILNTDPSMARYRKLKNHRRTVTHDSIIGLQRQGAGCEKTAAVFNADMDATFISVTLTPGTACVAPQPPP